MPPKRQQQEAKSALKRTRRAARFIDSEAEESDGEEDQFDGISSISSEDEDELELSSDDPFIYSDSDDEEEDEIESDSSEDDG